MIYDCFIFFNELDLLDIRLNILNSVVDKFVLVEATHTHQRKPKPLYFDINKERFKDFSDKIVHVVVEELSPKTFALWKSDTTKGAWEMEIYQRNAIARGLKDCKSEDTIIISDLDEIPDPGKIKEFYKMPGFKAFRQRNFYYYLNCVSLSEDWYGSVMGHYGDMRKPQDFRSISKEMHARGTRLLKDPLYRFFRCLVNPDLRKKITPIENGGWHFGYLGSADHIVAKIEAFAHDEYNTHEFKDKSTLQEKIKSGKDLFGRDLQYSFLELDNSFPDYIITNQHQLKHLIWKNSQ
jgi:beta-1,4-mannosyl-glycoprotein beta-1,4-N-acetylglucosaminyltransferase